MHRNLSLARLDNATTTASVPKRDVVVMICVKIRAVQRCPEHVLYARQQPQPQPQQSTGTSQRRPMCCCRCRSRQAASCERQRTHPHSALPPTPNPTHFVPLDPNLITPPAHCANCAPATAHHVASQVREGERPRHHWRQGGLRTQHWRGPHQERRSRWLPCCTYIYTLRL